MSSVVISGDTSGAITLAAPAVSGTNTITLPASTGTVMVNGPAFSVYSNATQNISSATWTKVSLQTEEFDTNNNFASSTFTPTVAGYYQFNACIYLSGSAMSRCIIGIYKNGSEYKRGFDSGLSMVQINVSSIVYCNGSTDYIELYGYINAASPQFLSNGTLGTWFNGSLIRSA